MTTRGLVIAFNPRITGVGTATPLPLPPCASHVPLQSPDHRGGNCNKPKRGRPRKVRPAFNPRITGVGTATLQRRCAGCLTCIPSIPGSPGWELQQAARGCRGRVARALQSPDHRGGNCNHPRRYGVGEVPRPSIPGSPGWELQPHLPERVPVGGRPFNPRITGVGTATDRLACNRWRGQGLQSPDHRGGNCNVRFRSLPSPSLSPSIPGSPGWELQRSCTMPPPT